MTEQAPSSQSPLPPSGTPVRRAQVAPQNTTLTNAMNNSAYVIEAEEGNARTTTTTTTATNGSVARANSDQRMATVAGKEKEHDEKGEEKESDGKKPLALCRFFVRHHKAAFALTLGLHIFMFILTAGLTGAGVDVIELNFEGVPLQLLEHNTYLRTLAWLYRDEDGTVLGKDTDAATIGERSRTADNVLLFYQVGDGETVFTAERLTKIQEVENRLLSVPEYQEYCKLPPGNTGSTASCIKPLSILRFFDGTYGASFNDSSFSDVTDTLYRASRIPQINQILQFHLAVDGNVTITAARSTVTRTLIYLGYPLVGYDLRADNRTEQIEKIRDFEVDYLLDVLTDTMDRGVGDMDFLYTSFQLLTDDLLKQVVLDMLLAFGSLLFILLFVLFMTRSLFITLFGIFSIMSSFVITNLVYRFVFQYRYFGIFHVLSIFIILGIGADNIFVFMDTWRATSHKRFPSLEHRLSECYRRAASATLYTSLTTMAAFFSNALSPLLAIQSFGLFSGILVFVNYMSVILFFPTVIVFYHKHWETWTWPCCRCCSKSGNESEANAADAERHHPLVQFFRGPFYELVTHRIARFVLLAVCLGLIIMFSVFAAKLEPDEKDAQFYQDGHHFSKADELQNYGFKPSSQDNVIEVYLVMGLRNQDLGSCDKSDVSCEGETRWDTGFDLNPKRAQSALLDFCERIQNLSAGEVDKLKIRRNAVSGRLETECFVERINDFMQVEANKTQYPAGTDLSLPTSEIKVDTLIISNNATYNVTTVSPLLYRYFETVMGYWLHDGYARVPSYYDYTVYSQLLGEGRDSFDTRPVASDPSMYWATKLVYAAIVVNTTLRPGTFSYTTGLPIVGAWDDFVRDQTALMPSTLEGMFQCTPLQGNPWHFLYVQKELADTASLGIAVGISLSFVVITLATKNIITGLLATLNIGIVTLSVVGLIPMAGWKLGVLESLNLSLVVGLAVDYVVHLAEGYHSSPAKDRLTRTRDMLDHVGISILSGALTTLGASVFMCAAVILFFLQFGIFMFATIGFSIFYALFGFTVLMGLLGPQGQTGSLVPVFWWLRYRLRGRRSHHTECSKCQGKGFHDKEMESREMHHL